jgi:hypothetical protein
VAQIAVVERETGEMFARVTAAPLAGFEKSEYLLVIRPEAHRPQRPEEVPTEEAPKKAGRVKRRG